MMAHGHLQALEAAFHPLAGCLSELITVIEGEAESRIHGDLVPGAAQQAPAGLVQGLALEIPEGEVDRGDGMASVT